MSSARRVAFLDVFSERPLAGNGLAVVDDADGVSDEVMLGFALETRLAETTFVQTARADGADYLNRIWTPTEEVPFAGHPSLGTAVAVARWRQLGEASFVQETAAGLQPIDVREEGGTWRASMLQGAAEFGPELDRAATMAAVGLDPADAHPDLPPQVVSTGLPNLMAPVAEPESLGRVTPDYAAIDELLTPHGVFNLYLAWCDPRSQVARVRSFAGIAEIGEDPATGSAAGPLCAYLADRRGQNAVTVRQGEEMGRPSLIEAAMEGEGIRVSGSVVPVIDGTVELPG